MKKLIIGLLTFLICINVSAKEITFTICEKENCDSKNLDDALTRAEDYSSFDTVNIILKDDYKVYELDSHDISSTINIKNRSDKKLDLIEIKGKNNCTITLKNTFSITNRYKNNNGEVDMSNVTFTSEEFRGNKNLVEFRSNFILKNINVDGIFKWEDYLRNLNNLDKYSYEELNGMVFVDSKVEADGLNINNNLKGIINKNSNLTIKNSDISNNSYSIYNYSGDISLDYIKTNSMIIGESSKSKLNITGVSEFINTIKFFNKMPSKYYDYKDYSNIILLNNSTYNFDLEATKNINIKVSINNRGVSLKRVFSVIDGIDYDKIKWTTKNKNVAEIKNGQLVPTGLGETDITSKVNDNIKYTIHVKVTDKSNSFLKFVIGLAFIPLLIAIFRRRNDDDE